MTKSYHEVFLFIVEAYGSLWRQTDLMHLIVTMFITRFGLRGLLLILAAPNDWLPAWALKSLLKVHSGSTTSKANQIDSDAPEDMLVQRLQELDQERDPGTARSLHAAIGKILRASGTQGKRAVEHFEAARDAAKRDSDPDTLLATYIELAEAYIEEGQRCAAPAEGSGGATSSEKGRP
jgi:hypothetical protein